MGDSQTLFDAYVMVDWSASSTPKSGADSLWICVLEKDQVKLWNPRTRQEAFKDLADLFSDFVARDVKVLAGFDFSFGYPAGFARELGLSGTPWQAIWQYLGSRLQDREKNANNRFELASEMNAALGEGEGPFWGVPKARATASLGPKKPPHPDHVPELRLTEERTKGVKPVWQLLGTGSVGGQTLTGIAFLQRLRRHPWLEDKVTVWPFETGLNAPARDQNWSICLTEIYPSQIPVQPDPNQIKDAVQVEGLARHYAKFDQAGELAPLFQGEPSLEDAQKMRVIEEEGWVLGVGKSPRETALSHLATYEKSPAGIYRLSEKMIRDEVDVSRFPKGVDELAIRMVHACGDVGLLDDIAWSKDIAKAGRKALKAGANILTDVEMVAQGIVKSRLPAANKIICTLNDPRTPELVQELGTTRSAAATELWGEGLDGAVVVIGNAPTTLFHLLQALRDKRFKRPAAIIGIPVGFVGAAESKDCLIQLNDGIPYITVRGRRGGSAIAAAALNALAKEGDLS